MDNTEISEQPGVKLRNLKSRQLNLAKGIKGNKKDFCKYIIDKRKISKKAGSLLREKKRLGYPGQ